MNMTTESPSKEIKVSYLKELRRSEVHFSSKEEVGMAEAEKSKAVNLAEKQTGYFNLSSWKDDETVFLSIGFVSMSIPINDFKNFHDFITETNNKLK